ncbi:putative DNA-binding protein [Pseudonocardia sp. Ae406_Ps2]|nr:putative DNA-binding protein [Pseudonocardia sp. Ae331_Ps2]OLL89395.1 putative DNA-binding protein [Pseudonocardia sp. Ae406_Ps2]
MTVRVTAPLSGRVQLGKQLRHGRIESGLSGKELANLIGLTQSRVSRIEHGKTRIDSGEVERWLSAVGASDELRRRSVDLVEKIAPEVVGRRNNHINGWTSPIDDPAALEMEASQVLIWETLKVPLVLQTLAYARQFSKASRGSHLEQKWSGPADQVRRQRSLYRLDGSLEVVAAEGALRPAFIDGSAMRDQLLWIASCARLSGIDISILPSSADAGPPYLPNSVVYMAPRDRGDNFVVIDDSENPTYETDPEQVREAIAVFRAYQRHSLRGAQAIEFVEEIAGEMAGGRSDLLNPAPGCDGE